MHFGFHGHRWGGRHGGPRAGRWSRGPFSVEWSIEPGDEEGGGRGRRRFDGGELRLLLLRLIADEPRHGYDCIRAVEERSGGGYAPSPGVVYPTLTLLDEMGLIEEARSEGAKRLFTATEAGHAHLAEQAELVDALLARLDEMGARQARAQGSPIRRAMGNLASVLRTQAASDAARQHEIADILDEAARRIERLA